MDLPRLAGGAAAAAAEREEEEGAGNGGRGAGRGGEKGKGKKRKQAEAEAEDGGDGAAAMEVDGGARARDASLPHPSLFPVLLSARLACRNVHPLTYPPPTPVRYSNLPPVFPVRTEEEEDALDFSSLPRESKLAVRPHSS